MDLETSDTSDKDVFVDSSVEKSSEDEGKKSDSSVDAAEEVDTKNSKGKSSSQGEQKPSSQKSASGSQNGNGSQAAKIVVPYSYTSGPDSLDANAAERIKSTTLRRQRKQVERLVVGVPDTTKEKTVIIPEGEGSKFEEIPYIADQINYRAGDLVKLHRFLYGRPGAYAEVKKHLRQFSGFAFAHGSPEYEKKKQALLKMETIGRDILCECLGLSKIGGKEAVVERVMDFLLKPSTEKVTSKLTSPEKRRSPSASPSKKVSPSKSPKEPIETSLEEPSSEEIVEPEESDYESEGARKTKKGRKKKQTAKKPKGSPKKKAEPAKKPAQAKKRKKSEQPDETSEEEPVKPKKRAKPAPKKKVAPTSDESVEEETTAPVEKKNGVKKKEKKEAKPKPAPKVPTFGAKKKKTPAKKTSPKKKQPSNDNTSGQSDGETIEKDADMVESTIEDSDEVSESAVRAKVMEILETADLEQVSTKMVIDQVKGMFPRIDEYKTIDIRNIIHECL